jgi:hypothetical protein
MPVIGLQFWGVIMSCIYKTYLGVKQILLYSLLSCMSLVRIIKGKHLRVRTVIHEESLNSFLEELVWELLTTHGGVIVWWSLSKIAEPQALQNSRQWI